MSLQHAQPGEVITLPLGTALAGSKTSTLAKTADLELIRLVLPAGKEIPSHKALGAITVLCLEGNVTFTVHGQMRDLTPGKLLYLTAGELHALKANEDSSVLVTLLPGQKV